MRCEMIESVTEKSDQEALDTLDQWYEMTLDEGVRRIAESRRRGRCLKPASLTGEAQHNKDDVMSFNSIQIAHRIKQRPLGLSDVVPVPKPSDIRQAALIPSLFIGIVIIAIAGCYAMYGGFLG